MQNDFITCTESDYNKETQVVKFGKFSFLYYEDQGYSFCGQMSGCKTKHDWEQNLVKDQVLILLFLMTKSHWGQLGFVMRTIHGCTKHVIIQTGIFFYDCFSHTAPMLVWVLKIQKIVFRIAHVFL